MASGGRPRRPWWHGRRGIALGAGVLVAAGVLTVVLTNQGGKGTVQAAQQVALQPVAATGPDPFTGSVAAVSATPSPVSPPSVAASVSGAERTVQGAAVGLYGGSTQIASCDVPKLSDFLTSPGNEAKARAWAGVEGIDPSAIPAYLRSLTPVVLRVDTRVTNHGFRDGVATPFQSVLQAGTAVLVDSRGLPRARCACGNPLLPPAALSANPVFAGTAWPAFQEHEVVVVSPAPSPVNRIVVVDPSSGESFAASVGSGSASASHSASSSSASSPESGSASSGSGSPQSGASSGASSGGSSGASSGGSSGSSASAGVSSGSASGQGPSANAASTRRSGSPAGGSPHSESGVTGQSGPVSAGSSAAGPLTGG
ncbi:DUF6777 domain-containing protein [Kitasatospora kazusensis]|uniref:DUF6777 domain-containing protein n=1 Tax=Kitasatospora kazusensis TaxID=407974 RepID=UPI0031DB632F